MTPGTRLELESIDPSVDRRRFYSMAVLPDPQMPLFDDTQTAYLLVLAWGRIGHRPRVRRLRFTSLDALAAKWRAVHKERMRHQYRTTREELPDGSWRRSA